MAEPAQRRMTVDAFLAWDDGTDTRYELVDGVAYAMAPPGNAHGTIQMSVGSLVNRCLEGRPPCRAQSEAGLRCDVHDLFVPDVVATCEPPDRGREVKAPFLVVEVLSPSTQQFDLGVKAHAYARLPSVQEIWLIDSERRAVIVWQRDGDVWIVRLLDGDATFRSASLDAPIRLDDLYRATVL